MLVRRLGRLSNIKTMLAQQIVLASVIYRPARNKMSYARKLKTLNQCWVDVGPLS